MGLGFRVVYESVILQNQRMLRKGYMGSMTKNSKKDWVAVKELQVSCHNGCI